jgi:hypothetical protein
MKTLILRSSLFLFLAAPLLAQSNVVLNGTAGTGINTTTTNLSTTGNLNLSLGFFAEYVLVGGGGGGAGRDSGGGGGGGGFLSNLGSSGLQLNPTNYTVTVGAGGAGSTNANDSRAT